MLKKQAADGRRGSGDALGVHGFTVMAVAAALFVAVDSSTPPERLGAE